MSVLLGPNMLLVPPPSRAHSPGASMRPKPTEEQGLDGDISSHAVRCACGHLTAVETRTRPAVQSRQADKTGRRPNMVQRLDASRLRAQRLVQRLSGQLTGSPEGRLAVPCSRPRTLQGTGI